jgi:hypothetical protein
MINILFNEAYKVINICGQKGDVRVVIYSFTDLMEYIKFLRTGKIQQTQFVKLLLLTLVKKI